MEHGGKGVLSHPLPSPAALDPPMEWDRLRRDRPVAPITFPSGDVGSLLTEVPERAAGVWTDEHGGPARNEPWASARRREDPTPHPIPLHGPANAELQRGHVTVR
jgi:hypothetical protein